MVGTGFMLGICVGAYSAPTPEVVSNEKTAQLELSNPTIYEVRMQTSLTIPMTGAKVSEIRLWQALPTKRRWSGTNDNSGAVNVKFAPESGVNEFRSENESNHLVWKLKHDFKPGEQLSFSGQYSVRSMARRFDPTKVELHWASNFTPPTDINPELAKAADEIRQNHNPGEAILEFCAKIKRDIKYDATVPYKATDVDATMANKRGQCGHIYNVFAQMCRRVGIPVRSARGMALNTPNGHGKLSQIRADWTNIHNWAEVEFPEVGWVEVEPQGGAYAFSIPARYIQNNKWFQNYVVKILDDGKWQGASFSPEDGVFVSPYNVANLITYRATPG